MITEVPYGRRNASRLEHIWRFDQVPGGASVTLFADVSGPSNDNEVFDFYFATSQNGTYSYLFTAKTDSGHSYQSAELPSGVGGTLYVKVRDSRRGRQSTSLDSLEVRHLYFDSSGSVPLTAPGNLQASALSDSAIQLSWTGASGEDHYEVERLNGSSWGDSRQLRCVWCREL